MQNKKERTLMLLTIGIVSIIVIFSIFNWDTILHLFQQTMEGADIVKENVQALGIVGVLAISLIIIVCFFVPVISPIPVELASVVSYGLPFAIAHVLLSVFVASQLAFLFTRSARIFHGPKQQEKQRQMELRIQNSDRSIEQFLLLAYLAPFVPFMLIHMVAASSGMKWRKYTLYTFLGPIPDVVITLWLGDKITSASTPVTSYVILMLIIVCIALFIINKERLVNWIFKPKKEATQTDGK